MVTVEHDLSKELKETKKTTLFFYAHELFCFIPFYSTAGKHRIQSRTGDQVPRQLLLRIRE